MNDNGYYLVIGAPFQRCRHAVAMTVIFNLEIISASDIILEIFIDICCFLAVHDELGDYLGITVIRLLQDNSLYFHNVGSGADLCR